MGTLNNSEGENIKSLVKDNLGCISEQEEVIGNRFTFLHEATDLHTYIHTYTHTYNFCGTNKTHRDKACENKHQKAKRGWT